MRHFFDLCPKDQLAAFAQMRDYLGADAAAETEDDRRARERAEALEVIGRVVAYLELPKEQTPTVTQFDHACRELGLPWTRSRVVRAWGRWRRACAAYLGEELSESARQLAYRRRLRGRRSQYENPLAAVRRWLATDPPSTGPRDYDAWVHDEATRVSEDAVRLPRSIAIRTRLELSWADVIRVARREVDVADLAPRTPRTHRDWTSGPHDLISIQAVAGLLGCSITEAHGRVKEPGFPPVVAVFGSTRAWLRDDVQKFIENPSVGTPVRRALREEYLDAHELAALIGLSARTIKNQPKATFPQPTGCVGSTRYWHRADVDAWIREHEALVARRRNKPAPVSSYTTDRTLVTVRDLEAIYGLSRDQADRLVTEARFPAPKRAVGSVRVWSRAEVEAYVAGKPLRRPQSPDEFIDSAELAALTGLSHNTVRGSPECVPPPAGRIGRRRYWLRADVEKWLSERAATRDPENATARDASP